jgi:hypothetical protein
LTDDPSVKLIDIAFEIGYTDPSQFSKAFRRWTGASPREYRRRLTHLSGSPSTAGSAHATSGRYSLERAVGTLVMPAGEWCDLEETIGREDEHEVKPPVAWTG